MQWLAGESSRRAELLEAVARIERGDGIAWLRQRDRRRRLARVPLPGGRCCFAKHYLASVRHPWREWWKRRLHLGAAEREWRTLVRLRAAGVPVPAPLAHARLASGQHVVVTEWIDGIPLGEALAVTPARRRLLAATGALVRALHDAGWVHRDLHRENILVADGTPVLIDLQAARRARGAAARLRDLGRLDHSLRTLLTLADRVRLRAAALGAERPFDAACRARLRAVGRASLARGRAHARSRAQRSLRAGRRAAHFEADGGRGLVSRAFDPAAVRALLAAPAATPGASGPTARSERKPSGAQRGEAERRSDGWANEDRPGLELRRYTARGCDLWHGSAARRAWAVAHALEASDVACVTPVAFLEWSRFGLPRRSALVVATGGHEPACTFARRLEAQSDLRVRMHEAGFSMPDLDPGGLALAERAGRIEAQVTALEKVSFPARPRRAAWPSHFTRR